MAASAAVMIPVVFFLAFLVASPELALVHGQPDSPGNRLLHTTACMTVTGFVSIDCGITEGKTYSDPSTSGLVYVSDAGFTDVGLNAGVRPPYDAPDMADRYSTVRYFPSGDGVRSCYTLRQVTPGGKYLVRVAFQYGNYDGLNSTPAFDLYLGVNRWATVNIAGAGDKYILEAVAVSPADFLQVCLVNTGLGTPFISGLDLRPLRATMYPEATVNQYGNIATWTNITTSNDVDVSNITSFDKPSAILRSAVTPLERVPSNALRQFDILVDNSTGNGIQGFIPKYLSAETVKIVAQGSGQHTVLLVATPEATLPPILNALEIYSVKPMTELGTNDK
nr:unnamed protein product [Digitaria exilis]